MNKILIKSYLCILCILLTQCYSTNWNTLTTNKGDEFLTTEIVELFNAHPNATISLNALSPAYQYKYDIGEKDSLYGKDEHALRFKKVDIRLSNHQVADKVLAHFTFSDGDQNSIVVKDVDLPQIYS